MSAPPAYQHSTSELDDGLRSAEIVVGCVLDIIRPGSVLDVGCGLGHFCRKFLDAGISDVLATDGDYLNRGDLCIPQEYFRPSDLTKPFDFGRKFDLVVSLEVAEHLPEQCADQFVDCLIKHGEAVLFSAAFPGQGGQNHLNEQWTAWWAEKFVKRGYFPMDVIRPKILSRPDLQPWYRFNPILYIPPGRIPARPMKVDFFEHVLTGGLGIKLSARCFLSAIRRKFGR